MTIRKKIETLHWREKEERNLHHEDGRHDGMISKARLGWRTNSPKKITR